ncbi:MAG: PAS domain-containing protein, partial [Thiohalocapsa sp.]
VIVDRTDGVRQRDTLRNAYDRLERSEEHYRALANFSPEWDFWLSADGELIHVSPACIETTGYSAIEFTSDLELLQRIIHADDFHRWKQHLTGPPQHGRDHEPLLFRIRARDGNERWIEHLCGPMIAEDGRNLGRRGINRDVTARMQLELSSRESTR